VYARYRPNLVIAAGDKVSEIPLLVDRPMLDGESAAYVCRRFVCHTPVTDSEALVQQLN
jgi:uncharacterized protein YyaL (SSP411 family)